MTGTGSQGDSLEARETEGGHVAAILLVCHRNVGGHDLQPLVYLHISPTQPG